MDLTTLISCLISGTMSLVVCLINANAQQRKSDHEQDKRMIELQAAFNQSIAIIDCKMENLTNEVREHNNFAQKIPVIQEQIKSLSERVASLENK